MQTELALCFQTRRLYRRGEQKNGRNQEVYCRCLNLAVPAIITGTGEIAILFQGALR